MLEKDNISYTLCNIHNRQLILTRDLPCMTHVRIIIDCWSTAVPSNYMVLRFKQLLLSCDGVVQVEFRRLDPLWGRPLIIWALGHLQSVSSAQSHKKRYRANHNRYHIHCSLFQYISSKHF